MRDEGGIRCKTIATERGEEDAHAGVDKVEENKVFEELRLGGHGGRCGEEESKQEEDGMTRGGVRLEAREKRAGEEG